MRDHFQAESDAIVFEGDNRVASEFEAFRFASNRIAKRSSTDQTGRNSA